MVNLSTATTHHGKMLKTIHF